MHSTIPKDFQEGLVSRKIILTLAVLMLAGLMSLQLGCGTGDNANASTDDSTEAEQTSQDKDAEGEGDDAEGKDKDGKDKDGKDKDGEDAEDEDKEEAVPVEVTAIDLGEIESVLRFSANLEAENQVQVFSQAKRLITGLLVEEGDEVRKDQVLVRLQDEEQRSALAKVESQLAKAVREYEQQERLYAQELISEQLFKDATYELEQLQISRKDARRELSYTEVTAPISGTVTVRMVNLGDQVQIGQHLFDVVDFESLVARVFVPEKHLGELRRGLLARLSAQSIGDTAVKDDNSNLISVFVMN